MNAVKQTFSDQTKQVLHNSLACGKINANQEWLTCPACGQFKVLRLLPETEAKNLPVFCKRCRTESIVNIPNKSQRL